MSFQSKTLREEAQRLSSEMNEMVRAGLTTTEQRMKFDTIADRAEKANNEAIRIEREEARTAYVEDAEKRDRFGALMTGKQKEHATAFANYLRRGMQNLDAADRRVLAELRTNDQTASMWGNVTGQSYTGTAGTQGGVLVPASFMYDVDVATKYYCPMLTDGGVRVLPTATGAVLPFPTNNDTGNQAAILADATQASEVSPSFGVVNFGAYKFTSQIVRVSIELMQDSAFNLEDFLKQEFAVRFGRAYESYCTTGTGSSQPTGILTAVLACGVTPVVGAGANVNDGVSPTSGAGTKIGTNDLISLEHGVDPSYRRGGKFMLSDASLKIVKQLLDRYGRPIWLPSISTGEPATILGYDYIINQSLPSAAGASANALLFGDMQKFVIRLVRDMQVIRLDERYADYGQVGFIAFSRIDSNLVDAGTHPINVLQQHS
jgi:HK97 family phage major capsid protein